MLILLTDKYIFKWQFYGAIVMGVFEHAVYNIWLPAGSLLQSSEIKKLIASGDYRSKCFYFYMYGFYDRLMKYYSQEFCGLLSLEVNKT